MGAQPILEESVRLIDGGPQVREIGDRKVGVRRGRGRQASLDELVGDIIVQDDTVGVLNANPALHVGQAGDRVVRYGQTAPIVDHDAVVHGADQHVPGD